jgi:hypothetical protein
MQIFNFQGLISQKMANRLFAVGPTLEKLFLGIDPQIMRFFAILHFFARNGCVLNW